MREEGVLRIVQGVFLLSMLLFFNACSQGRQALNGMTPVGITMTIPAAVPRAAASKVTKLSGGVAVSVATVSIVATDPEGVQLASATISVTPGEEVTISMQVPAGERRTFTAKALAADGTVLFEGQVSSDLVAGVPAPITILMIPPGITIVPSFASVLLGQKVGFTASLSGVSSTSLSWSVTNPPGPGGGTIVGNGVNATYTAPLDATIPELITIKVSSSNPNFSATATVAVVSQANAVFVSSKTGVDASGCGATLAGCKTVTEGLKQAGSGGFVLVEPGTYPFGGTAGDPIPLTLAGGVTVIGAGCNLGLLAGLPCTSTAETILDFSAASGAAAIVAGDNSVLAGFTIQSGIGISSQIDISSGTPAIAANTFALSGGSASSAPASLNAALSVRGTAAPNIEGNTIGESGSGFTAGVLIQDNAAPILTGNLITQNIVGVQVDGSLAPDLGGGPGQSPGGNSLSCNSTADLIVNSSGINVSAQNNLWDHLPPTGAVGRTNNPIGIDILTAPALSTNFFVGVSTTGAGLAASPCGITRPANTAFVGGAVKISASNNYTPPVVAPISAMTFTWDGQNVIAKVSSGTAIFQASWDTKGPNGPLVPDGSHTLEARVGGTTGPLFDSISVIVDNTPPAVTITSPTGNIVQSAPAPIPLTATATDTGSGVKQVEFFVNGLSVGVTNALTSSDPPTYQVQWTPPVISVTSCTTFKIQVVATDQVGNQSLPSSITVNTGQC